MKRVCAWCKKVLGETDSGTDTEFAITHGLCEECAFHLTAQSGMPMREFLNGLGAPILAVDPDGKVLGANGLAEMLIGRDVSQIEGQLCGEVFECEHSLLSEGCGRTVHCLGCAIRKAVIETFQTGRSIRKVPAHISRTSAEGPAEIRFWVSTEKAGKVVLLRVEPASGKTP